MKYFFVFLVLLSLLSRYSIASSLQDLEPDDNCHAEEKSFLSRTSNFFVGIRKFFKRPDPIEDVKFYLYTRQNPTIRQELKLGNEKSVKNSNFDVSLPVRILIHGYASGAGSCVNVFVRDAYLENGNFNVIVIDWSIMTTAWYTSSMNQIKNVADTINKFTRFLNTEFNVPFDNIYLIGHSLGAHVAGLAGRGLKPDLYNTIFALDPAGPSFEVGRIDDAIRAGDAFYVEAIQTNIQLWGFNGQLGNASIYPAYGTSKTGHSGAYLYFAQSINEPEKFVAQPCDSYQNIMDRNCVCKIRNDCYLVQMGGEPSSKKNGVYYLNID